MAAKVILKIKNKSKQKMVEKKNDEKRLKKQKKKPSNSTDSLFGLHKAHYGFI